MASSPPARLGGAQIVEDDGRTVLVAGGALQSVSPTDSAEWGSYWAAMVPPFKPQRALLLGLGGATMAHLLVRRFGEGTEITGVDDDPAILQTVREAGWLEVPGLTVHEADAFEFVRTTTQRFDYVAIDLYRGPRFPAAASNAPFLDAVRDILDKPGWLAINFYGPAATKSRLERLRQRFNIEHTLTVGENLVVHGQLRLAPLEQPGVRVSRIR